MAKVIEQGFSPVGPIIEQFIPSLEPLKGMKLGLLPSYLDNYLKDNDFILEKDSFGNPYIVDKKDNRVAIAIAIVDGNEVCAYTRDGSEPNLNDGIDIIGSMGYALPSLKHKVSEEMLELKIHSARLAENYAWETTDGDGDKRLVKMPIILLELEESSMCSVPVADIQNPTAKMQVVIDELS